MCDYAWEQGIGHPCLSRQEESSGQASQTARSRPIAARYHLDVYTLFLEWRRSVEGSGEMSGRSPNLLASHEDFIEISG